MQVKQRLKINVVVSVAAALVILLIFFLALYRLNKATNLTEISGDIVLNSFERVTLRNDYLQNNNERAKIQWFARHEGIGGILKAASKEFQASEDRKILDEMLKKHEAIGKIFSAIVENREKKKPTSEDASISHEVEDRLLSQLNIKVYEEVVLGRELLESSRQVRSSTIRLTGIGIAFLSLVLILAVISNSWTMGRAIADRVRRLRDGASMIGGGDLDYRIDVKGDDEFAELSDAFNEMTTKIKMSYRDLGKEVEERKRAEEALRKAHDELETRVQGRTKELNEARETLEQRVEERTSELQAANASLRDSRRAALNLMEDAVAARGQAEEASVELRREATERRRAEEATRKSQRRNEFLANIIELSSQPFGVGYPDGHLGLINKAFELLTGYSTDELQSTNWVKTLTPPEWLEIEQKKLEELHHTGRPVRYEKEYIRKNGTRVPIELLVHLVTDAEGKPQYYYSFFTDITERKRAEEALRESEMRFRALVTASSDVVYRMNPDWSEMRQLRGRGFIADTENPSSNWLQEYIHPDDQSHVKVVINEAIRTKSIFELEHRVLRVDGTLGWTFSRAIPLLDANGEIVEWFGAASDITERKRAEADVIKLSEDMAVRNVELETVNRQLESFVYSVSHDLRAPLRHMSGFATFLVEDYTNRLDEQGREYLARIKMGSEKMSRLIEDLLYLSKISRQEIERREVDMSGIASSILSDLREAHPERGIESDIEEGLSAFADPGLIEIVLSNLLGNAWKFTSKTEKARIEVGTMEREGKTVYYVRDNGAGFDSEYARKMFLPFHRLHSDREFEGTGIGLTIVERVIHRHGGMVWAEGETEKGATIYFTLE